MRLHSRFDADYRPPRLPIVNAVGWFGFMPGCGPHFHFDQACAFQQLSYFLGPGLCDACLLRQQASIG